MPSISSVNLPPPPDPAIDPAAYLRSIYAVRERTRFVVDAALENKLTNFNVDLDKLSDVTDYVVMIIKVCLYGKMKKRELRLITVKTERLWNRLWEHTSPW